MIRDLSRSRAFLAGNGAFREDSGILSMLPEAEASLQAMTALLGSEQCGWPADRITTLVDAATPSEFSIALHTAAQSAQDVLLVYYVGRSLRTARGELALAMRDTLPAAGLLRSTGLLYDQLIELLTQSPAATKLLILDCATSVPSRVVGQPGPIGLDGRPLVGDYRAIGAGLRVEFASPDPARPVVSPFTAALVDAVRAGIPGQSIWLTTDQVFASARGRMFAAGLPEPASVGAPNSPVYVFARNAAVGGQLEILEAQGPLFLSSGPLPTQVPVPVPVPMAAQAPDPGWTFPPAQTTTGPVPAPNPRGFSRRNLLIGAAAVIGVAAVGTAAALVVSSKGGGGSGSGGGNVAATLNLPDAATAETFTASGTPLALVDAGATIIGAFYKTDAKGDAAGGCEVFAWKASDGSAAWHTTLPGTSLEVIAQENLVICTVSNGTQGDVIYAFDPATGAQQWKYSDGSSYLAASMGTGSTIYVGTNSSAGASGTVIALDLPSGNVLWTSSAITGFVGYPGVSGTDIIVAASTVAAPNACYLYSFDQVTGTQNWATTAMAGFDVQGYYQGSTVLALCTLSEGTNVDDFSAVVVGIDQATGDQLWQHAVGGTEAEVQPMLSGESLLLFEDPGGSAAATLVCVDPTTGDQRWKFTVAPKTTAYLGGDFEVSGGVVYAFDYPSASTEPTKLSALSLTDGTVHWSSAIAGNTPQDVLFSDGLALVPGYNSNTKGTGTGDCQLSIFELSSGALARQPVPLPGCVDIGGSLISGKNLYILGESSSSTTSGYTLFTYSI